MYKIKESDLLDIVQNFDCKPISLELGGIIKAHINIYNSIMTYNKNTGIIKLKDKKTNNFFKIDISPAYKILVNSNFTKLQIELDNGIIIYIRKSSL